MPATVALLSFHADGMFPSRMAAATIGSGGGSNKVASVRTPAGMDSLNKDVLAQKSLRRPLFGHECRRCGMVKRLRLNWEVLEMNIGSPEMRYALVFLPYCSNEGYGNGRVFIVFSACPLTSSKVVRLANVEYDPLGSVRTTSGFGLDVCAVLQRVKVHQTGTGKYSVLDAADDGF
jgi:hypothetical protein